MQFRKDINGLRAVAVIAVVVFPTPPFWFTIAKTLAMQGASVAATDRFIDIVEETVSEIEGVETLALKMDVTSQDDVDAAFAKVNSEWGQLDIVVNNAGSFSNDAETLMAVNLYGVERCCEAAIPQMKERRSGKIVNIGSTAGHTIQ